MLFTKRNFGFLPLPLVSDVYRCSFFLILVYNKLLFLFFLNLKILHELKLGSLWDDWMKPHLFIPSFFWAISKTFTVTFVLFFIYFKIYNSSQFLYFIGWYNFNSLMFLVFTPPFSFFYLFIYIFFFLKERKSDFFFVLCSPLQLVFIFYVVHVFFMDLIFFSSINLIYFGRSEQNH